MKEMIIWTDEERIALVKETVRLMRQELFSPLLTLVKKAMKTELDQNRQRKLLTIKALGEWFPPMLRQEFDVSKEVVEVPVEVVLEIPQSLKKVPTAVLLTELLVRFAGKLDQIERLLPTIAAPPTHTLGQELSQASVKSASVKPKVLVAGMKNNQLVFLEHKLGHAIDFKFIESDASDAVNLPINVDKVYLITKFASHTLQQRLRNQYNGDVKLFSGGLVSLTETIAKDLHIVL